LNISTAVNKCIDEPKCAWIYNPASQQGFQDQVIDGRKIFDDVPMKGIRILAYPGLAPVQRLVNAFTYPAGVAVMDKTRFPDRLDHLAQGMVHDPVAKWRGAHQAALGFEDIEIVVAAGLVGVRLQFFL